MAAVYAADDEVLGREVAVKVLGRRAGRRRRAPAGASRARRAPRRARPDHPNVVTIYDIGETDGDPPRLHRHGAADRRHASPSACAPASPSRTRWRWLARAGGERARRRPRARAWSTATSSRPTSCSTTHGELEVADFGIATLASEAPLTMTGQVVGTAAYLSPEQALGRPATAASDRYALAVVAFELLTGHRPFTQSVPAAQALAHVGGRHRRPRAAWPPGSRPPSTTCSPAAWPRSRPTARPPPPRWWPSSRAPLARPRPPAWRSRPQSPPPSPPPRTPTPGPRRRRRRRPRRSAARPPRRRPARSPAGRRRSPRCWACCSSPAS